MALFAGDIKIDPALRANLGGNNSLGTKSSNSISDLYGRIRQGYTADAKTRGVRPGSYGTDRLNAMQGASQSNLSDSLEGILGDTAYTNFKADRGYKENSLLAKRIGALNKPNTLEEILGALGVAGKAGGQIYGAYQPSPGQSSGSLPTNLSLFNPTNGYARYS